LIDYGISPASLATAPRWRVVTAPAKRVIPAAACSRSIPATECLAWHVHGRIPGSEMSADRRVCTFRCPNHDDRKPSAAILVGDEVALNVLCHACGKDAKLEIRAAVIRAYGIDPKCLPLSRDERVQQEEMLEAVFMSTHTPCTRLVCVRAILDGVRGPLPPAPALVVLGGRAGVSERQAYRARSELRGGALANLFLSVKSEAGQAPEVKTAFLGSGPLPDRQSLPDWQRNEGTLTLPDCQIGSDAKLGKPGEIIEHLSRTTLRRGETA
jgi:hypothetical protein